MDKRQSLIPIFALLGTLGLLLACSRLTNIPGSPSPTAPPPGLTTFDAWMWIERFSWVATLVGLPIAAIALGISAWQEKRVADEVSRRAVLTIGLTEGEIVDGRLVKQPATHGTLDVTFSPGQPISDDAYVDIWAYNEGDRSARSPVWNFIFPSDIGIYVLEDGPMQLSPRGDGSQSVAATVPRFIHPADGTVFKIVVEVPRVLQSFTFRVEVSLLDEKASIVELTLNVRDVTPAPLED